MISVGKATSTDYYTGGAGADTGDGTSDGTGAARGPVESYYLDAVTAGEPPGTWSGTAATELGLTGEVTAADMHAVYSDHVNPATGEAIGRAPKQHIPAAQRLAAALEREPDALPERVAELRREIERTQRHAVIGWDVTFSVPKSVTVAHTAAHRAEVAALRAGDEERAAEHARVRQTIETAIRDANAAMLTAAAGMTVARAGRHGGHGTDGRWVAAPGLVVASFPQHTSRSIDPQLHVHNVILNRARCEDGQFRALDGTDLLANKHALSAVADRVLEERLSAAGFDIALRPDGVARELVVVDPRVAEQYSTRSRQIAEAIAPLVEAAEERFDRELTDLELDRLKRAAAVSTRASKGAHAPETREELLERWHAELIADVGQGLDATADTITDHLDPDHVAARRAAETAEWSESAAVSEAIAAVAAQRSTWRRADLMGELALRLPTLGIADPDQVVATLEQLTDTALLGPDVVQVAGPRETEQGTAAGEQVQFRRPSERLYTATSSLVAEDALRRAAVTRGRRAVDAAEVHAWLDTHGGDLSPDKREAVTGLATSDAAVAVLIGPAGTGKTYAVGMFARAWNELTGGRVFGLAVSEAATQVLADDGLAHTRNVDKWLAIQDRLDKPRHTRTMRAEDDWALTATDVVVVDETSMAGTAKLDVVRTRVDAAGARLILTGDPRQLGAVEAGGVLDLLDGHAETYTLSTVHRFANDWERDASLALRDPATATQALAEYDRRGRLLAHDTTEDALQAAATAAVADRVDGKSTVVVGDTNATAAAAAALVREQLLALGLVEPAEAGGSAVLGRDQNTASRGDLVMTRHNDYRLGVINGARYVITGIRADGGLTLRQHRTDAAGGDTPRPGLADDVHIPADYVAKHVQLGYASTIHSAQGLTVDTAHFITDGRTDPQGLYVAMTRGRHRNTAHVITTPTPDPTALPEKFWTDTTRPSALAVLDAAGDRTADLGAGGATAATVVAEHEAAAETNAATVLGKIEALTRQATRARLEGHLDDLVADGTLTPDTRARLCADQGTEHLSRLLRAVEQAGHDPREALRDAASARSLTDAKSAAQVLAHRVTRTMTGTADTLPLPDPAIAASPPSGIDTTSRTALADLQTQLATRRQALGSELAKEPPAWAIHALGPIPTATEHGGTEAADEDGRRQEWQTRAGAVAAHREASGWDHPTRALGPMPGLAATERRASYAAAWVALGRPTPELAEAAMSDGQLRARYRAWQTELDWAPPHADDALKAAETETEEHRQAAALARAHADRATSSGDHATAERLLDDAHEHELAQEYRRLDADGIATIADARAEWVAVTAVTREHGERALAELRDRDLDPGTEPDRVTTAEWLAAHHQAQADDDAHREITPRDVVDEHQADDDAPAAAALDALPAAEPTPEGLDDLAPAARTATEPAAAHQLVPRQPTRAELESLIAAAQVALTRAADRTSSNAHDPTHQVAEVLDDTADRRQREARDDHVAVGASQADSLDHSL